MPLRFDRATFQARIQQVRRGRSGDGNIAELAKRLGIPARTWANFEAGVVMPDSVLLRFLHVTGIDSTWLLTGEGSPFPVPPG